MSVKGKVMQLFLLLIWAGENGISRVKLQDFLYDRRSTDAANALRITTTRLRKNTFPVCSAFGRICGGRKKYILFENGESGGRT